jgi:DNA-binding transcriptional LysR family regulator
VRTEDLRAFFEIAESGSFTAAARALGIPKSTLSRRLSRLEDELHTQLVLRTSRSVQLTETGLRLHRDGGPALARLDAVQRSLEDGNDTPTGTLRISAAKDLAAAHLGPLLGQFSREHPGVALSLETSNAFVDVIARGIDVALRIHAAPLASVSSLKTRKLASLDRGLYAAPDYLEHHGRPRKPQDLEAHGCLTMTAYARHWHVRRVRGQGEIAVSLSPRLVSDDHHSLRHAAEEGAGIAALPTFLGEHGVCRGTLTRVLPNWSMGASTLSALWPVTHHPSPRVRAFVAAAATYFKPPPWARTATP